MGLIITAAPKVNAVINIRNAQIGKTYRRDDDSTKLYMAIRRLDGTMGDRADPLRTSNMVQVVSLDHGNTLQDPSVKLVEVVVQAAVTDKAVL